MTEPLPSLRELADTDPAAFVAQLCTIRCFEDELVGVLELIQTRPTLFHGLREGLPPDRLETLRVWVARRLLPHAPNLSAFCAQATAAVQARVPDFPALLPSSREVTQSWYAGWVQEADTRIQGIGWVLYAEERDDGPAETVHIEDWWAEAHGEGWTQRIVRETVQHQGWTWAEPVKWEVL